jgi:hypothetical protein
VIQEMGGEVDHEHKAGGRADATQRDGDVVRTTSLQITMAPMPHGETPEAHRVARACRVAHQWHASRCCPPGSHVCRAALPAAGSPSGSPAREMVGASVAERRGQVNERRAGP